MGTHALVFPSPWGILSLATIPQPPGELRSGWLVSPATPQEPHQTCIRYTLNCKRPAQPPGSQPQRLRVHDNSRAPNARSPRGKVTCSSSSSASQCPAPELPRTEVKLMSVEPVQTPQRGGCPVLPLLSDRPTNRWRASAEFLEGMDECIAGERQTTTVVVQPPSSSTSRGPLKRDSRASNARKRQHR